MKISTRNVDSFMEITVKVGNGELTETVLSKNGEIARDLIYAARDVANFNNMTDVDFCFEAAVDFLPNTDMEQLILKLKGYLSVLTSTLMKR